ncbi:hypothetical protein MVEG_12220 [Podila verticillata NRRL 6337]|uniref:DUF7514 domain-containing protein n=1 Tax=Podila verticillata NRRL 6337 TaxID=1069443 RepID=A0A086TIV9_9FUNG|nr:hypothetical protein MVEG_12220 [Podila verticillata NRRL 6337]
MAHQFPLLDHHYNSTETLRSFSSAVFSYLDMRYEPKGTQLLEPEKMKVLLSFLAPKELVQASLKISSLVFNAYFLAFHIETVFTAHGPSVTQAGLLAYFRSEIMSHPNEAFASFNKANQVMQLGPPVVRSQFPTMAEPRSKELSSYIDASIAKTIKDMGWSSVAAQEEELNAVKVRIALEQRGRQAALDLISPSVCYSCRRYPCTCGGALGLI